MTILTVRMRNPLYEKRHLYVQNIPEYYDSTGEVLPPPKCPTWIGDKRFCLSTNDRKFKFRVLEKENIMCGWLHER